jgi:hypothetical protein
MHHLKKTQNNRCAEMVAALYRFKCSSYIHLHSLYIHPPGPGLNPTVVNFCTSSKKKCVGPLKIKHLRVLFYFNNIFVFVFKTAENTQRSNFGTMNRLMSSLLLLGSGLIVQAANSSVPADNLPPYVEVRAARTFLPRWSLLSHLTLIRVQSD